MNLTWLVVAGIFLKYPGGSDNCYVLKRGVFAHTRATFFPLFRNFGGPPKAGGGGGILTPRTLPPWISPCSWCNLYG